MKSILAIATCLLLAFNNISLANDFKLIKRTNEIEIYERWLINRQKESVRELKVCYIVKSDIPQIIALLQHPSKGKQWNRNANIYKTIALQNKQQFLSYIKYDMPLMMDDQDCLLLYQYPIYQSHSSIYEITFNSRLSNQFPISDKIKRITGVSGKWIFEKKKTDYTKVTYIISSDRNKSIPRAISDPIVQDNLIKSMNHFKKLLEI